MLGCEEHKIEMNPKNKASNPPNLQYNEDGVGVNTIRSKCNRIGSQQGLRAVIVVG